MTEKCTPSSRIEELRKCNHINFEINNGVVNCLDCNGIFTSIKVFTDELFNKGFNSGYEKGKNDTLDQVIVEIDKFIVELQSLCSEIGYVHNDMGELLNKQQLPTLRLIAKWKVRLQHSNLAAFTQEYENYLGEKKINLKSVLLEMKK